LWDGKAFNVLHSPVERNIQTCVRAQECIPVPADLPPEVQAEIILIGLLLDPQTRDAITVHQALAEKVDNFKYIPAFPPACV
jgi:hypothetical protein